MLLRISAKKRNQTSVMEVKNTASLKLSDAQADTQIWQR